MLQMRSNFVIALKRSSLTSFMSTVQKKPPVLVHQLTSSVFDTTPDGNYPWNVVGLLEPHEMLRRELARGTKALDNFNLQFKPHQSYCFKEWFETFMKQALVEHDVTEQKVLWPFYYSKGITIPLPFIDDRGRFEDLIQQTIDVATDLDEYNSSKNLDQQVLQSKVDELRATYGALVNLALRRYADEERFWPNNYQKHGEDQFNTLREAMGEFLYKQVPESFMTNPCAQLACMGIAIEGSSFVIAPEEDKGWAGPVLREKYLSHMHRELRTKILPAANKPYMACRTLIDACSEEGVTMLQVDDKVQQIMR